MGPELPAPSLSQTALPLHTQRRGTGQDYILLQQIILLSNGLGPKPVTLLQSLLIGAGPAGCLETLQGLWERLQKVLPAVHSHCSCLLPPVWLLVPLPSPLAFSHYP